MWSSEEWPSSWDGVIVNGNPSIRIVQVIAAVCLIALISSLFIGCEVMMKGGRLQRLNVRSEPAGGN